MSVLLPNCRDSVAYTIGCMVPYWIRPDWIRLSKPRCPNVDLFDGRGCTVQEATPVHKESNPSNLASDPEK